MTSFVRRVRQLLDRTAKTGRRRWLCARVPCFLSDHDALGIDLAAMADVGLDMVNLSAFYFTEQQSDLAKICRQVPDLAVYLEMTHCTTTGPGTGNYDSFTFRRTTDQQFYTTAHLAYESGAAGVSLFNFVYYREHGAPGRGPFNEPPFHVLPHLKDPSWLARQPQWYVVAKKWTGIPGIQSPLPQRLKPGQSCRISLDLAPAETTSNGLLRLMTEKPSAGTHWTVKINGHTLAPSNFVAKPIDHAYDAGLGRPEQYACFVCPRAYVHEGKNNITIQLQKPKPATLVYLDLVLPNNAFAMPDQQKPRASFE